MIAVEPWRLHVVTVVPAREQAGNVVLAGMKKLTRRLRRGQRTRRNSLVRGFKSHVPAEGAVERAQCLSMSTHGE